MTTVNKWGQSPTQSSNMYWSSNLRRVIGSCTNGAGPCYVSYWSQVHWRVRLQRIKTPVLRGPSTNQNLLCTTSCHGVFLLCYQGHDHVGSKKFLGIPDGCCYLFFVPCSYLCVTVLQANPNDHYFWIKNRKYFGIFLSGTSETTGSLHLLGCTVEYASNAPTKETNIQISKDIRAFFFLKYIFLAKHRSSQVGVNYIYGHDCKVH